jgi:hypothetical protein
MLQHKATYSSVRECTEPLDLTHKFLAEYPRESCYLLASFPLELGFLTVLLEIEADDIGLSAFERLVMMVPPRSVGTIWW